MRKSLYLILIISHALLFNSCNNKTSSHKHNSMYYVDITNKGVPTIDTSIIASIKYIPLQAQPPLGGIDKLIFKNGMYYILDNKTNGIYVFNSDGSFQFVFNTIGRGPNEVGSIIDFSVNDDGDLIILDNVKKKLHVIRSEGAIESISISFQAINIGAITNNSISIYRSIIDGTLNSTLSIFDINKNKLSNLVNLRDGIDNSDMALLSRHHLYHSTSGILFNNYFSDIIYSIKEDRIYSLVKVVGSLPNVAEQKKLSSNPVYLGERSATNHYLLKNIYETTDYLTFESSNMPPSRYFFSKKTGRCFAVKSYHDSRYYGSTSICGATELGFISYMDPSRYTKPEFWRKFLSENMNCLPFFDYDLMKLRDTNPFLIVFNLKEF